jgi:cytochrome c oxidase assembly protein subunit 15
MKTRADGRRGCAAAEWPARVRRSRFDWKESHVAAFGIRLVTRRLTASVLRPSRDSVRAFALASVIANAILICTGAAVRLSSSGLGCPDWPRCTETSVVAAHSPGQTSLNTAIEFGNRLLTFPLAAIAALTFIACLCYKPGAQRRPDLTWLSAALPAGVIAQAVAGGIVVLTKLNPVLVAVHFLLSSAILAAAVVLHARVAEEAGPARSLVRADLRILAALLAAATALMLAAGTVVTGTGPLAGTIIDSGGRRTTVPRFRFPLQDVTQLHADIGWFIGALAVALVIGLRFTGAPASTIRASRIVLAGLAVQGTIGYVQYFSHLPAGLVWLHVTMSVALWIFVLRLYLSTRVRGSRPGESVAAETAAVMSGCGHRRLARVPRAGVLTMRAPRLGGATRLWARAPGRRIRFSDAVPVRRDRRELRRRFRRAARAAMTERKAELTAVLRRLSADHVPLSGVVPGPRNGDEIVAFRDGTRLLLSVRYSTVAMKRLVRDVPWIPVCLAQVQPCYGRCWFRLWFASAESADLVEVLVRVEPFATAGPEAGQDGRPGAAAG